MSLVAGIHTTLGSTEIEVRDHSSGRIITRSRIDHEGVRLGTPGEGEPTQWLRAVRAGADAAVSQGAEAVAIAGPLHSLVMIDGDGVALRPALLAEDRRSEPDAGWCAKKITSQRWLDAVGSAPSSVLTVTKLSWVHRSEPTVWERVERFASVHDYLTWALAGAGGRRMVSDRATLSATGIWSPATSAYDTDILALIDSGRDWLPALPELVDPLSPAGELGGALLAPGTGDVHALAVGLGLVPGDLVVMRGDRTVVVGMTASPVQDSTGAIAVSVGFARGYLPMIHVDAGQGELSVGVLDALAALTAAGVPSGGRLVVATESAGDSLGGSVSGAVSRKVETVVLADALVAGAARRAAAVRTGSWPAWPAVPTTQV